VDLTQKVNVRGSLPLARPLVLFEKTPIEDLSLISLLRQNQLRGGGDEEREREEEEEREEGGRERREGEKGESV
jgi:hypothetical protein